MPIVIPMNIKVVRRSCGTGVSLEALHYRNFSRFVLELWEAFCDTEQLQNHEEVLEDRGDALPVHID